jgi:hypothetical protein
MVTSEKSSKKFSGTKSDFIRSYLDTVPAEDVMQEAKRIGLDITKNFVYKIRHRSKLQTAKACAPDIMPADVIRGMAILPPKTPAMTAMTAMTAEQALCCAASELGYIKALDVLDDWVRGLRARRGVK